MKLRLAACLIIGASFCFAQEVENVRPYVRVSGGLSFLTDSDLSVSGSDVEKASFDPGYSLSGAAGLALDVVDPGIRIPVRVEVELGHQQNNLDKRKDADGLRLSAGDSKFTVTTLVLNYYVDFDNKSIITPYLMAGIGAANVNAEIEGESSDETVFAGQVGAGLAVAVSENVSIDTEYRYFLTENPEFDGFEAEISGHRLQLGVRYTFN